MKIFEFKTEDARFHIDLAHVQLISALRYVEEPYKPDNGFGPGSGGVTCGRSEGKFSITLMLRDEPMVAKHCGQQQANRSQLEQRLAEEHGLGVAKESTFGGTRSIYREIKPHSDEVKKLADSSTRSRTPSSVAAPSRLNTNGCWPPGTRTANRTNRHSPDSKQRDLTVPFFFRAPPHADFSWLPGTSLVATQT